MPSSISFEIVLRNKSSRFFNSIKSMLTLKKLRLAFKHLRKNLQFYKSFAKKYALKFIEQIQFLHKFQTVFILIFGPTKFFDYFNDTFKYSLDRFQMTESR